jgi:hypothetical protein
MTWDMSMTRGEPHDSNSSFKHSDQSPTAELTKIEMIERDTELSDTYIYTWIHGYRSLKEL